jgi:hypothetical protein
MSRLQWNERPPGKVAMIEIASLWQAPVENRRSRLIEDSIVHYMDNLDEADPVQVYEDDDGCLVLLGGHHRVAAALRLGRRAIEAEVKQGDKQDALQQLRLRGRSS